MFTHGIIANAALVFDVELLDVNGLQSARVDKEKEAANNDAAKGKKEKKEKKPRDNYGFIDQERAADMEAFANKLKEERDANLKQAWKETDEELIDEDQTEEAEGHDEL